jgi:hypothetical protein
LPQQPKERPYAPVCREPVAYKLEDWKIIYQPYPIEVLNDEIHVQPVSGNVIPAIGGSERESAEKEKAGENEESVGDDQKN